MGFFSELFKSLGGPEGAKHVFNIPWRSEGTRRDYELSEARVFLSDINDISASDIAPILDVCKRLRTPLALVTPGVDGSVLRLLDVDTLVAIKATDLPGQPVRDLLEDAAVIAGGTFICKDLRRQSPSRGGAFCGPQNTLPASDQTTRQGGP